MVVRVRRLTLQKRAHYVYEHVSANHSVTEATLHVKVLVKTPEKGNLIQTSIHSARDLVEGENAKEYVLGMDGIPTGMHIMYLPEDGYQRVEVFDLDE